MPRFFAIICLVAVYLVCGCATVNSSYKGKTAKEIEDDYQALNEDGLDDDEIVCKQEKPLGSNISRKVCDTKKRKRYRSLEDADDLDYMQRNSGLINQKYWRPGPRLKKGSAL